MRRTVWFLLIACIPCYARSEDESGFANDQPPAASELRGGPDDPGALHSDIRPLVTKYCTTCHGPSRPKGGLDLSSFPDATARKPRRGTLERIREYVEGGIMPPEDSPQPSRDEVARLSGWIKAAMEQDDRGRSMDPGRVTIRRLNRAEYNNTIRDLVGIDFRPADDFPSDDVGYGFDNIGDVLSLPPVLMERYLAAAESISDRAIVRSPNRESAEPLPDSHRRILFREPRSPGEYPDAARHPRAVCDEGLSASRQTRGNRPALEPRGAGAPERRQLRARHSARDPGRTRIAALPLPGRARLPAAGAGGAGGTRIRCEPLGDFELASRLSYFLWSRMPDEELFDLAARGNSDEPEILAGQVGRMLKDPKVPGARGELRRPVAPDPQPQGRQPGSRPVPGLRRAAPRRDAPRDRAFLGGSPRRSERARLPRRRLHVSSMNGLPVITAWRESRASSSAGSAAGPRARRPADPGEHPDGDLEPEPDLAGQARKWVLEQLLGDAAAAAAAGVAPLEGGPRPPTRPLPLRQRMEQHRARPNCAVCHNRLDPLGFGLENYDGVGAWRDQDGGRAVDSSGTLPSGESFRGPGELKAILKARPRDFARCLTEKMLTYALGRGLEDYDRCAVERIVKDLESHQYRLLGADPGRRA